MQLLRVVVLYVFAGVTWDIDSCEQSLCGKNSLALSCSLTQYDTHTHTVYIQLISVCSVCMAKTMGHLAALQDTGQWFDFGNHWGCH